MKHYRFFIYAVLMMALTIPECAKAYDVSAVASSGQTLYFTVDVSNSRASVTPESATGYTNAPTGVLYIPDSVIYNGTTYPVYYIGENAFKNCAGLTTVVLPNTIRMICYSAFYGCTGLTSINFPNSLLRIDPSAFQMCQSLVSINIPNSVTVIGATAFSGCSNLTTVTLGNAVNRLNECVFSGCHSLTSIVIPDAATVIDNWAFRGCSSLESVSIGSGVTVIGYEAFCGCSSLTSIDIPDNVTGIWGYAFAWCGLESVTIGNGVTHIEACAFYLCSDLTSVTIGNAINYIGDGAFWKTVGKMKVYCLAITPPEIDSTTFNRNYQVCDNNFYVPCESVTAYQNASNWSLHAARIHGNPFLGYSADFESNNETMGSLDIGEVDCDSNVIVTAVAEEGYHFVRWNDGDTLNPRTMHLSGDTSMTAIFCANHLSIEDMSAENVKVSVMAGQIVINGVLGKTVRVFDIMGREVAERQRAERDVFSIDIPVSGVYVVKIGDLYSQKVVMVK